MIKNFIKTSLFERTEVSVETHVLGSLIKKRFIRSRVRSTEKKTIHSKF